MCVCLCMSFRTYWYVKKFLNANKKKMLSKSESGTFLVFIKVYSKKCVVHTMIWIYIWRLNSLFFYYIKIPCVCAINAWIGRRKWDRITQKEKVGKIVECGKFRMSFYSSYGFSDIFFFFSISIKVFISSNQRFWGKFFVWYCNSFIILWWWSLWWWWCW